MIKLQEPYRPRAVRFLELWEQEGWRVKDLGAYLETRLNSDL